MHREGSNLQTYELKSRTVMDASDATNVDGQSKAK